MGAWNPRGTGPVQSSTPRGGVHGRCTVAHGVRMPSIAPVVVRWLRLIMMKKKGKRQ